MLFISLHVRAVELVILVKPIAISTNVVMSIFLGARFPTFLDISVLLKVLGISAICNISNTSSSVLLGFPNTR